MSKKTIIYAIITIVLVVGISAGTVAVLGMVNKNKSTNSKTTSAKKTVDSLRDEAEKARKSNDKDKAKELLLQAQKQNEELPKSDTTTNTSIDIEAQLYLLEHAKK